MVVLIVDDEKIVAESMAEIFRLFGDQSFFATNAAEARILARQTQPQLLITDVVMPKENGIDLAIEILEEIPACKVLLISGQAETSNLLERAERQGRHFEILAKPVPPHDLVRRAHKIVEDNSAEAAAASN